MKKIILILIIISAVFSGACWAANYSFYSSLKINSQKDILYTNLVSQEKDLEENEKTKNNFLPLENLSKAKTIIFVGDIMLDRGVEILMEENSFLYPFEKISQFLKGINIVFGNLEGPIVESPPKFDRHSLTFAFSPKALEGLKFANFNLLSLANNHTLNMGENGLKQTREFLEKENINFTGDPIDCTGKFIYKENNIIFLAFNKTFNSSCGDEKIVETVQSIKSQEPEKFLVVSLHWGQEYQTKSSVSQKNLAHKIIAAGADLIIGHHPHVVQEIEIYKNKLIFYSLGNFIFDQYFSEETQEGLAVGLEIWPDKNIFLLFPIQSEMSQPFLMEQKEKEIFLKNLAGMSSGDLIGQIEKGKLEIKIEQIAE